jgi:hypothetical protein
METQQVKSAIYETCKYWVKILNMLTAEFFSEERYFMYPGIDFGGNVNVQFFVTSSTELERLDIFISVNRTDDVGWEPFDEIEIERLSFTQIEIIPGNPGSVVSGKMLYGEKLGELNVDNIANSLEEILHKFDEVFPNTIENFKKIEQTSRLLRGAPEDIKEFFKNNPAPVFSL